MTYTAAPIKRDVTVKLDKSFYCYYCKDKDGERTIELMPLKAVIQQFKLKEGMEESHALDVWYICPECGLHQVFGVVLSEEQVGQFSGLESESEPKKKVASNK